MKFSVVFLTLFCLCLGATGASFAVELMVQIFGQLAYRLAPLFHDDLKKCSRTDLSLAISVD